ncbi:dTMP kinase [Terriglobus roseus]|uniref:Thymidylate kinase n=1 Tax=Terriglobus roseus TaxID=392734 RepID=A0A1G7J3E2_9BACT|nr:dTMP kinase [Terriglobus roseus]SDF19304.1 thymidylate kinase [Terriglobus roseus]
MNDSLSQERGFFITFEGPDGSGKTTQIRRTAEWLQKRGIDPVLLRQPGGTPLGEKIRAILLDSRAQDPVSPLTELALMFGDRAQSIHEIILPALREGRVILCDRYTDSSEAYQGAGRGLGSERVLAIHRAICDDLQPNLTILLLPDVEKALERASRRNQRHIQQTGTDENRFEAEGEAFYRRVHTAYVDIAKREPKRVALIGPGTGDDGIEAIASRIREIITTRLEEHLRIGSRV